MTIICQDDGAWAPAVNLAIERQGRQGARGLVAEERIRRNHPFLKIEV
jgi:hypothetical protein